MGIMWYFDQRRTISVTFVQFCAVRGQFGSRMTILSVHCKGGVENIAVPISVLDADSHCARRDSRANETQCVWIHIGRADLSSAEGHRRTWFKAAPPNGDFCTASRRTVTRIN